MMFLSSAIKARAEDLDQSNDLFRYHNSDTITFGGVRSGDYGVYLTDVHTGASPRRDVSFKSVAGRSGDLILDNQRWSNLDITYSMAIPTNFSGRFDAFKAALLSLEGYQRLTDSIYPDVYRMAIIRDPISPETMRYNRTGVFDIVFHCKPQRFLTAGAFTQSYTAPASIYNRYGFSAKPLITIWGSGTGTVTVGATTVKILGMTDHIILDCDLQNAYRQMSDGAPLNMNGNIYAPQFPVLAKGENPVSWTGGVTQIDIVPRWWIL